MTNSEEYYLFLFLVIVIQHHMRALPKLDNPFSKLRQHLLNRTSNLRMSSKSFHALSNCTNGALRGLRTLRNQKPMKAAYVKESSFGPLQT